MSARLSLPCSQAAPEDGVPLICLLFQREALRLEGTCPLTAAATPSQDAGHLNQEGWGESGPGGHAFPDHTTLRPMQLQNGRIPDNPVPGLLVMPELQETDMPTKQLLP